MSVKLNRGRAEELIGTFLPMFDKLEASGVDYCLVGGLAVLVHSLLAGGDTFRATRDADVLVPNTYPNDAFARAYLETYALDPVTSRAVYEAMFGDGTFEELSDAETAFANMSFVGASADLDGVETPDFDVCRVLSARDLASVARERVIVCGKPVWVATVDELRGMKAATIDLYKAGFSESSRPQDFEDLATLDGLAGTAHGDHLDEGAQGRISIADRIRSILGGGR